MDLVDFGLLLNTVILFIGLVYAWQVYHHPEREPRNYFGMGMLIPYLRTDQGMRLMALVSLVVGSVFMILLLLLAITIHK